MKTFRQVLEDMSLAPKGKGREGAKKLYKASYEEDEISKLASTNGDIEELSIAQVQQRRRNRKQAHLLKTMAKYRAASDAGIHPSKVNQRRTQMTVKKESRLSIYDALMEMEESEAMERPYICVHAIRGKTEVYATSSYKAAKEAADKWGLKSTAGINAYLAEKKIDETGGVGKVVPGINTSVDVGPNEIKIQAAKFGNDVDKDGVPKKNLR